MSASRVLFDEPGPRGRRRIMIGTVISLLAIAALIALAVDKFAANGQLAGDKWSVFGNPGIPTYLWNGLLGTLKVTGVAAVVAFPFGALLALLRLAEHAIPRWIATAWIEVFRSVPLLVLVLIFVLALPPLGLNLGPFWQITIPVILCASPVIAEVMRAGILALPRGQREAGLAIGLRDWQVMRLVVLPQAFRLIVPSLVTQLVSLLKDSTLGYAASYAELLKTANNLTAFFYNFIQSYLLVGVIFVVINLALSTLARWLEHRINRGGKAVTPTAGGARAEQALATQAGLR